MLSVMLPPVAASQMQSPDVLAVIYDVIAVEHHSIAPASQVESVELLKE